MIGYFAMLDGEELKGLRDGSIEMEAFLSRIVLEEERCIDIDKAWAGLRYLLLGGREGPGPGAVDPVLGGKALGEEDAGYGPARTLAPDEVRSASEALGAVDFDGLRGLFRETVLGNPEVYPCYEDEEDFNYLEYNFGVLKDFFSRCAAAGKDMLLFIA